MERWPLVLKFLIKCIILAPIFGHATSGSMTVISLTHATLTPTIIMFDTLANGIVNLVFLIYSSMNHDIRTPALPSSVVHP